MKDMHRNSSKIETMYEWALSEKLEVPSSIASEAKELRNRIGNCKLKPRDPATYERQLLRLMKAVFWLRWNYETPYELQGDQKRVSRLRNLLRNLNELDMFDDIHLSAYLDSFGVIRRLRAACEQERKRLSKPFQLQILHALAEIYPFLTSFKLSTSKGSKFMELAGEIDGFITGRELADHASSMADYAERHGFDIGKYSRQEEIVNAG